MNLETKQCKNCKQNFTIEPEDFEFYDKNKDEFNKLIDLIKDLIGK